MTEGAGPAGVALPTIGIAGGGQLAQMMLPAAKALGLRVVVLDPDPNCSAGAEADDLVVGGFDAAEAIAELAVRSDVITFEIEKINVTALRDAEAAGTPVRPSPATLEIIQDKLVQKQFLRDQDIPTSAFVALDTPGDFFGALPRVWKSRRDGYDGRGVAILRQPDDVTALPAVPALLEDLVDIRQELAIMVARSASGEMRHYPVVELFMDAATHVMDALVAPADIDETVAQRCRDLASAVAAALDYTGVLALEFFVDGHGDVLVNELSPRPHNSGHYTIEACATSQFEQHLRAVAGLPLGPVDQRAAAVTFNVLGAAGALGQPHYIGFEAWPPAEQVYVHSYGKPEVRPGRKMGHVTVLGATRAEALAKSARIRDAIRVESVSTR